MILIFFILISLAYPLSAQEIQFQQEQYPFPVTFYGVEPQLRFTAANAYYHHDFGDLDDDGDFDLIVGADFENQYYFENTGNELSPLYTLITSQIIIPTSTAGIFQPSCLCDIDNDNDLDIFLSCDYQVAFYENISSPDSFIFFVSDSSFTGISNYYCEPSLDFVDIDADGDYDLFLGFDWTNSNGRLHFYRNVGTPELPIIELDSEYFAGIDVGEDSSPEFCDIDSDGDCDLFIGCEDGTVWFYENIGDSLNYDFEYVTNYYFNIDVGNMSVPRFCDIDGDEDFDLFVANESVGNNAGFVGDMDFYENIGTATDPDFQFITGQFLFMDMCGSAKPYAVDIDSDSLTELIVCIIGGQFVLLENEGTTVSPELVYADSSYLDLTLSYQPCITLGDLDADGDLDMVAYLCGFSNYVKLYNNIGSASQPEFEFVRTIASSSDWSVGGPDLVDIDADGDLDLFFSDGLNHIQYWENTGDSTYPVFEMQSENYLNQPYNMVTLYPRFNDLDHDSDYDLVVGNAYFSSHPCYIQFWENTGTGQNPSFIASDTIDLYEPATIMQPSLCLSDIDNDGDLDMFVGEGGGAMLFYRNLENPLQPIITISIQGSNVILTWGSIANAVEYRIFYQNIPYFTPAGTPQAVVLPPDTSWTDYGAVNEGGRFYRMVVEY